MSTSEALRALRELRGWSIPTLADRAGVPPSHIEAIEQGQRKQRTEAQLCRLFGIDPFTLQSGCVVHGEGPHEPDERPPRWPPR